MIRYFNNPELKKSSLIILLLSFAVFVVSYFTIKIGYEKIKVSYIESNATIAGKIIKNHPELKSEVIPLITKVATKEEIEEGKSILKNVGFNKSLDISFIPAMSANYNNTLKNLVIVLVIFCVSVFVVNLIQYIRIYKKLEMVILASENMLEDKFDITLYENSEGIFSKLSHSFNNMRYVIKNNLTVVQEKKDFLVDILSDISHQIKTPIAALIIYNDILLNRNIQESKRNEFLKVSKEQLNRIEWLVKSLLKLAKLDAGAISFEKRNYDLNETVKKAVDALRAKALKKNIKLTFICEDDCEIIIKHDKNWLKEAVINLIKNALEHTQENGLVQIFTERTPVCARIIVKDNGEGISKDELPHIFKRFFKGKRSKSTESVGIGLALSKSIVEEHEGIIEVKSKEGEGTAFKITFLYRS